MTTQKYTPVAKAAIGGDALDLSDLGIATRMAQNALNTLQNATTLANDHTAAIIAKAGKAGDDAALRSAADIDVRYDGDFTDQLNHIPNQRENPTGRPVRTSGSGVSISREGFQDYMARVETGMNAKYDAFEDLLKSQVAGMASLFLSDQKTQKSLNHLILNALAIAMTKCGEFDLANALRKAAAEDESESDKIEGSEADKARKAAKAKADADAHRQDNPATKSLSDIIATVQGRVDGLSRDGGTSGLVAPPDKSAFLKSRAASVEADNAYLASLGDDAIEVMLERQRAVHRARMSNR